MHFNNDVIMEQDNTQYQSESPESQKQNKDDNTPRKERMEIEINKYKQLVDAISNPRILKTTYGINKLFAFLPQ